MPETDHQPSQFRILFRIFWLRVVDLEVLSPDNDARTLLGHLAALLAGVSVLFTAPLILIGGPMQQSDLWTFEHLFFATTLTAVGGLAVLSWDSALPDRRDLLVLGPLPLKIGTIFAAKISALAGVLGFSAVTLNFLTGLIWPLLFSAPGSGLVGALRSISAYWITIGAVVTFTVCVILCLQGAAALILPRQLFLRLSSLLQLAAFTILFGGYLLEPSLENIAALTAPENSRLLHYLPSYWFLGLFQQLNGTMKLGFEPLAGRAWIALAISLLSAATILLLAWALRLSRTVEQPDIVPNPAKGGRSLSIGNSVPLALVQFAARSLLRSRQHRLFYAFYLSIGMAIAILYTGAFTTHIEAYATATCPSEPVLASNLMILCFAVLGFRIVIDIPVVLRANWIFQLTQTKATSTYIEATRHTLLALSVMPVWLSVAAVMLFHWPSWATVVHILAFGIVGLILTDVAILGVAKVPFACSYLPGKGKLHFVFWGGLLIGLPIINGAAALEHRFLLTRPGSIGLLASLAAFEFLFRWYTDRRRSAQAIVFQEEEPLDLLDLKLNS